MRKTVFILFIFWLGTPFLCRANEPRKAFIRKYKDLAIEEMHRTGIPASIKLAQAILESGCGHSHLAVKANNHFGIKCHNWKGATIYKDDDAKNECFRKYRDERESWIDHSEFLCSRAHYAPLFELAPNDYKAWSHGLKKAGYATAPDYAQRLIRIIEEESLHQYDRPAPVKNRKVSGNQVMTINKIPCIRVQAGDSFESIARRHDIPLRKLLSYNDKRESSIREGMIVYLKPKKNKAARGYHFHTTRPGESLYMISQQYGVKLSRLIQYNYMEPTDRPQTGELIALRSKTPLF